MLKGIHTGFSLFPEKALNILATQWGGGVLYSDKHGLVQILRPVVAIKFKMTV